MSKGGVADGTSAATNIVSLSVAARVHRAVELVCKEGPVRVMELVELGAQFTRKENGALHLTREGGHSHRRIVHAADVTGREIERALLDAARARGNISFFEHHAAIDLVVDEVMLSPCSLSRAFGHGKSLGLGTVRQQRQLPISIC
jgi:aspartate oxidase